MSHTPSHAPHWVSPEPLTSAARRLGFTPAVVVGGVAHVSGQVGIDRRTGQIPASLETQVERTFDALELVLAAAGSTLADVFSLTSYHVGDMAEHMAVMVAVKARRMGEPFPAWTSIGVTALAVPGLLVEVSALAIAGARASSD